MPNKANQKLTALVELWENLRSPQGAPARADLPVKVLRPWLGHLALFEFQTGVGPVFRLCGTRLHSRFEGEVTGRPVSTLQENFRKPLLEQIEQTKLSNHPRRTTQTIIRVGEPLKFHDLYLPLKGEKPDESYVLFASYCEDH